MFSPLEKLAQNENAWFLWFVDVCEFKTVQAKKKIKFFFLFSCLFSCLFSFSFDFPLFFPCFSCLFVVCLLFVCCCCCFPTVSKFGLKVRKLPGVHLEENHCCSNAEFRSYMPKLPTNNFFRFFSIFFEDFLIKSSDATSQVNVPLWWTLLLLWGLGGVG